MLPLIRVNAARAVSRQWHSAPMVATAVRGSAGNHILLWRRLPSQSAERFRQEGARRSMSRSIRSNGKRQKATLASDGVAMGASSSSSSSSLKTERITLARLLRNWKSTLEEFLMKPRTLPIPRWITPKHYQFTASEFFGHASFVLVAVSYSFDDFMLLRVIAVAGSASMLVFTFFHPHGRVLWLPFKWNLLFIAINSYRIGLVLWQSYAAENLLPEELVELRKRSFYLMDPVDFYRLVRLAEIKEYKAGDLVIAQGEGVRYVRMVLSGELRVLRDGKLTYLLEPANFMSEAGIHAGLLLPGKIESCCSIVANGGGRDGNSNVTRVLCWDRTDLVHMMEVNEGARRSIKAILSWDIVRKLKAQRLLLTKHIIHDPEEWTERRHQQSTHRYAAILHALLQQPKLLERYRKEVMGYRMIHHIDDEEHADALAECGWTVEEYEAGKLKKPFKYHDDEDDHLFTQEEEDVHGWRWYLQDIRLRLLGC